VQKNCLYYGDNLTVLRDHIKDESVDLIYLAGGPPLRTLQGWDSETRAAAKLRCRPLPQLLLSPLINL
jgi:hypothetical protein